LREIIERKLEIFSVVPFQFPIVSFEKERREVNWNLERSLLIRGFPEFVWWRWIFPHISLNFWKDRNELRAYLDWISVQMWFTRLEDFYSLDRRTLSSFCGGLSLDYYFCGDLASLFRFGFPRHTWKYWRFQSETTFVLEDVEDRVEFIEWIGSKKGIWCILDLKNWFICEDFGEDKKVSVLLSYYQDRGDDMWRELFPEIEFNRKKSEKTVSSLQVHRKECGYLGISVPEDFVSSRLSFNIGPRLRRVLRSFYENDLVRAVSHLYPEFGWMREFKNGRLLGIRALFQDLDFFVPIELYNVDIISNADTIPSFLVHCDQIQILLSSFPELDWCVWQSGKVPFKFWKEQKNWIKVTLSSILSSHIFSSSSILL